MMPTGKTVTAVALAACLACAAFASAPGKTPGSKGNDLRLATVNGDPVTARDLLAIFTDRHGGHAKFLGGEEEARTFLRIVIDDRLLVQEAYALGLNEDPDVVALVEQTQSNRVSDMLLKSEIEEKSVPTAEEVEMARQGLTFFVHARQIAVADRNSADEVRRAIAAGADIETFARSCSLAESRGNGGHIAVGWGQQSPEWEKVVFALGPGEISEPIETEDGWEVVVVIDRIDMAAPPLDQVASDIRNVLSRRKLDARKRALSEELWSRHHATISSFEMSAAAMAMLRINTPDLVVASWDGGSLPIRDLYEADEVQRLSVLTPKRFRFEVEKRIRATVNATLVAREARARKLTEDPEVASEVEQFRQYMMESLLFRDHIYREVNATDEDLQAYFDAHRADFVAAEQRHVAHIMVPSEADAKAIVERLAAGADFAETARKSSRDFSTATNGGDLGWITEDKVPPAFKGVLSLPAGALMKPTNLNNQWHVVKVLEIKAKRPQEFAEVKDKVRDQVLAEKRRAAKKFWVDKLRDAAKIDVDAAAIKEFVEANTGDEHGSAPPSMSHAVPAGGIPEGKPHP